MRRVFGWGVLALLLTLAACTHGSTTAITSPATTAASFTPPPTTETPTPPSENQTPTEESLPTYEPPPTSPLPQTTQSVTVRIVSISPDPVYRGNYATAKAKTSPNIDCDITVEYKSGPSTAKGLGPKTSTSSGNVSWTWLVGGNTTPGDWPVTVTCADVSDTKNFSVRAH